MALVATDYELYAPLLLPPNDTGATGGGINLLRKAYFVNQLSAASVIWIGSDGADTRSIDFVGYLPSGIRATETKVLNGATGVTTTMVPRYLMSGDLQTSSSTRTVTVRQGNSTGPIIQTIPPNETGFTGLFDGAASSTTDPLDRVAKLFIKLLNSTFAAVGAIFYLVTETTNTLMIGPENSINGTQQVANRTLLPPDVTFSDKNIEIGVIGNDLAPLNAQPVWFKQSLAINNPAFWAPWFLQFGGAGGPPP